MRPLGMTSDEWTAASRLLRNPPPTLLESISPQTRSQFAATVLGESSRGVSRVSRDDPTQESWKAGRRFKSLHSGLLWAIHSHLRRES